MMERTEILAAMVELKLHGMKAAYDEVLAAAVKRQHEPQRVVGDAPARHDGCRRRVTHLCDRPRC